MKLTQQEIKKLKLIWTFKELHMTFMQLLRVSLKRYLIFFILTVFALVLFYNSGSNYYVALIGIMIGAILTDFRYLKTTVQFWPLDREIIDWNKVDELIKKNE